MVIISLLFLREGFNASLTLLDTLNNDLFTPRYQFLFDTCLILHFFSQILIDEINK